RKVAMRLAIIVVSAVSILGAVRAQEAPLTPKALEGALTAKPQGAAADQLAARIRSSFGDALARGAAPKIDELTVAWALETPASGENTRPPRVVSDAGGFNLALTRVGSSNVYAGVTTLSHGTAFTWHYEAGDRRLGGGQLEVYATPPDGREQTGVPKGTLKQMPPWKSTIFSGTTRDWWVYVPAQYRAENPAAVMVFQDGSGPKDYVPVVFDNLIAKGDMP